MKFKSMLKSAAAALVLLSTATVSQAQDFLFELTGAFNATWTLPGEIPGLPQFDVSGTFSNLAGPQDLTIQFFADEFGGFLLQNHTASVTYDFRGPVVFDSAGWKVTPPAHELIDFGSENAGAFNLSITAIPAVPEPETYAMMLAGLGAIGFMSRRRRVQTA